MPNNRKPLAIVTGASRGIGQAVVFRLVEDGWRVLALDRSIDRLQDFSGIPDVSLAEVDVSVESSVSSFYERFIDSDASIGALVNNAAIQGGAGITEQSLAEWQEFIDTNLTGSWLMTKYARPYLETGSSIVNVGSVASVAGFANRAAYCASKHALVGLTRSLAVEFAEAGIRVNLICLGSIATPGLNELAAQHPEGMQAFERRQLLNRCGNPEEAADAISYLLSRRSSFMTGSIMTVDGGMTTKGVFA